MRVRPLLAMFGFVCAAAGCERQPATAPDEQAPIPGASCSGSLTEYCRSTGGRCPTYDEALDRRIALCSRPGAWSVAVDRCTGSHRSVVWREAVLGGGEEYFDADGRLVGAFLYTDYPAHCRGTSFSQTFGDRPGCGSAPVSEPVCGSGMVMPPAP